MQRLDIEGPAIPRQSAGPAFRGQGGYGVVAGLRMQVTAPVAARAGNAAASGIELTVKDPAHDQEN